MHPDLCRNCMRYGLGLCPRGESWKRKRKRKIVDECDYYLIVTRLYFRNEWGH